MLSATMSITSIAKCIFLGEKPLEDNVLTILEKKAGRFLAFRTMNNLTVQVTTDKTIYKRFEPVNITISVTNNGDEDVTITLPYCNLLADFNISYKGLHYRDSYRKILLPAIIDVVIPSGETKELLNGIWYQLSNNWLPFPPGKYIIRGWIAFNSWPFPPTPPFGYSEPIEISKATSKFVTNDKINIRVLNYTNFFFHFFY